MRSSAPYYLLLYVLIIANRGLALEEIYNKEHLNDIYHRSDGSGRPRSHAILALYEPKCRDKLYHHMGFKDLASELRLLTLTHDWKTSREVTWYNWTSAFDLTQEFDVSDCPSVYHLPMSRTERPVKWDNTGR